MKVIILAGGFSRRLLPLTKHIPKPLLPVNGRPIVDYVIEKVVGCAEIDQVLVATNLRFENHFRYWLSGLRPDIRNITRLVFEPATSEEEKPGAVRAIYRLLTQEHLTEEEILVVAGDNLFSFDLSDFIGFHRQHPGPAVAFFDTGAVDQIRGKYGAGILDTSHKIVDFEEKPDDPKTTLAATGCYVFPPSITRHLEEFLTRESASDAPGHFVRWLCQQVPTYGYTFKGYWFDIGSVESYDRANEAHQPHHRPPR